MSEILDLQRTIPKIEIELMFYGEIRQPRHEVWKLRNHRFFIRQVLSHLCSLGLGQWLAVVSIADLKFLPQVGYLLRARGEPPGEVAFRHDLGLGMSNDKQGRKGIRVSAISHRVIVVNMSVDQITHGLVGPLPDLRDIRSEERRVGK